MDQTRLRRARLCCVVPAAAGSFTAAIMLGPLQPPPTAPLLRAGALTAVFLNFAPACAGPACSGVLQSGTLPVRVVRALAYGAAGAGGHRGVVIGAGLLRATD